MGNSGTSDTDASGSGRLPIQPPKPGKALSGFLLLVGLAIIAVGAFLYVQDSGALENRVEVTAEVTGTGVEQVERSRGRVAYVSVVTFEYTFRGTEYTSDRLFPGDSQPRYESRAAADSQLAPFTVGESVTAYVDPDAPGAGFLKDSRSGQATGALIFGAGLALVGGGRLYQVWKHSGKLEHPR